MEVADGATGTENDRGLAPFVFAGVGATMSASLSQPCNVSSACDVSSALDLYRRALANKDMSLISSVKPLYFTAIFKVVL